ncbi:MAG: HNH endonuclease signature motif containing protein [Bacillota bacterium]
MSKIKTYPDKNYSLKAKQIQYQMNDNGCWECVSHWTDKNGYAQVWRFGAKTSVHRYVYEQEVARIPEGFVVMHKCDNPTCFNPSHLEVGTLNDNNQDKVSKNRQCSGVRNGRSKLTELDVIEIFNSKLSGPKLARMYNVSHPVIYKIKNGKRWAHVTKTLKEESE